MAASGRSRGQRFEDLIQADDEDDKSSRTDEAAKAPQPGLATVLGVPGFFAQASVAVDKGETGAAGAQAVSETETSASIGSKPVEARASKARAAEGRAPVATLAAALQAQADGFAAGRTMAQSASEALASSGIVRLHGASTPADLTLGTPTGQATPATPGIEATVDGKPAKPEGSKSENSKSDVSKGAALQAASAAKSTDDLDAEIPQTAEAKVADAGARPDVARAPLDRIQTLQTSAAPATPSAAAAQPVVSGAVAAAVQVANEIASHAASRRSRFEIQLDPGDLGRVDVRLDIAHDGRVATRLIVERPETLDMLRNDARELSRTLEQAGFQLGQGGLAFQLKDGRQGFWTNQSDPARVAASDEIEDVAPVAAAYSRSLSAGAAGVDVMV